MKNCGASSTGADGPEEDRAHEELQMAKVGQRRTCGPPDVDVTRRLLLQEKLGLLRVEEEQLLREIQSVRAALNEEDTLQERLKQQAHVSL